MQARTLTFEKGVRIEEILHRGAANLKKSLILKPKLSV